MSNLEKAPDVLDKAFAEWRKRETLKKEKISVDKFASFLGYSRSIVGFWLNRDRKISEEALISIGPKLAELLGEDIYRELDIPKPDPSFEYVKKHWDDLPGEIQKKIKKIISEHTDEPIPNEAKTNPAPKS